MKVVSSSDWRDSLAFETPVLVADVVSGDPTRCFVCGPDSEQRLRTELWAVKHRHPRHHDGFVRFYCREHTPAPARPATAPKARTGRAAPRGGERPAARPSIPERQAALCPNCFVEVPPTGVCGMCGTRVA